MAKNVIYCYFEEVLIFSMLSAHIDQTFIEYRV